MILGVVLAGGMSRRFGSDKALAEIDGQTLIAHAVETMTRLCDEVIVAGRQDAPAPTVPDWPRGGEGPLGGIAAGLHHARDNGYASILTCGVDAFGLPDNLLERLSPAPAYVASQRVIGHWPVDSIPIVERLIEGGGPQSMRAFVGAIGARAVELPDPPRNINTPADLAAARRAIG